MQLDFDLRAAGKAPVVKEEVFGVGQLTRRIRELLERDVGEVWVEGEVSNVRRQASGHVYFTLKDDASQLACVMFAGQAVQLRGMNFADGVQVQVFGQITVYEARGNYQILVRKVREKGIGDLQARFEELKRRLAAEGLFDAERKRSLPRYPRRIGVVTSPTGAAIRDFLNVLGRRQRGIAVVIHPVRVQGRGAAAEIAAAVRDFGREEGIGGVDVIVVTRGGGSLEDLWEFNDEEVARAIAASPVPVVSAVGHEIDFTISDFAADVRAATPSAAAELLSADSVELMRRLADSGARMGHLVSQSVAMWRQRLDAMGRTALYSEPRRVLRERRQDLDRVADDLLAAPAGVIQSQRLVLAGFARGIALRDPGQKIVETRHFLERSVAGMREVCERSLQAGRSEVARNGAVLAALSPSAALARGFTMTMGADGRLVRSCREIEAGEGMVTRFIDGEVRSVVVAGRSS